jgi:hypothetical protein
MKFTSHSIATLIPATLLVLSACQSSSPESSTSASENDRAQISEEYTATAQVVSVNKSDRSVTLRRDDGSMVGVNVGKDVRNFDQIAAGDVLKIHYKETLVATKLTAKDLTRPVEGAFAAGRAKEGMKPAGGVAVMATTRVKIESIDRDHDIVVFSRSSGELVTHRVTTPEGKKFLSGLSVGDIVQLDGAQAVVLSIESP